MNEARIDKWMWAVRIFKTRTIAAEACKKGRISINGALAKAARTVKPGDVIQVRKPPVTYSFKVLQPIEKRVGAKLVAEMMENVTTPEQYELLEMSRVSGFVNRAKGTGRPTKKDRRSLEEFTEPEAEVSPVEEEFAEAFEEAVAKENEQEEETEDLSIGEMNPYTGREYESNSVRMHPKRIGYVQVYSRKDHKWQDMTEWAFLGEQERKKVELGDDYVSPIYLD